MTKWVRLRREGDDVIVDTSDRREIYRASPMKCYPLTPYQRADQYINAIVRNGWERKPDVRTDR